jgi:hypothetical protein
MCSSDVKARLKRQRSQRESLVMSIADWRDVSLMIFSSTDSTSVQCVSASECDKISRDSLFWYFLSTFACTKHE